MAQRVASYLINEDGTFWTLIILKKQSSIILLQMRENCTRLLLIFDASSIQKITSKM
jgi:hypothetical protein